MEKYTVCLKTTVFELINRYECPAGCLDAMEKVVGTVYYEMVGKQVNRTVFFPQIMLRS